MNSNEIEFLINQFPKLLEDLKAESDRGVVLVLAAMVENELNEHLKLRLRSKAENNDELLQNSASNPISTFSAKINLAYRIGLITMPERTIYHHLRKIRNRCAHDVESQDFDQNHFKDRMKNIITNSHLIWDILCKIRISEKDTAYDDVEDFVEEIGWRSAFEAFFAMVILHKKTSRNRVIRITSLTN